MAGLLLYANSLDCGLCFDDEAAIRTNSDLRANSSWHNLLWDDFWGMDISDPDSHKSYRPLCVATFRLNYLWHGLAPMGYHVVNVGLHAVVCYLYVQLCVLIFKNVWPALLTGLLFAAHPIHTEAVSLEHYSGQFNIYKCTCIRYCSSSRRWDSLKVTSNSRCHSHAKPIAGAKWCGMGLSSVRVSHKKSLV